jgi:hypothetical protein
MHERVSKVGALAGDKAQGFIKLEEFSTNPATEWFQ